MHKLVLNVVLQPGSVMLSQTLSFDDRATLDQALNRITLANAMLPGFISVGAIPIYNEWLKKAEAEGTPDAS